MTQPEPGRPPAAKKVAKRTVAARRVPGQRGTSGGGGGTNDGFTQKDAKGFILKEWDRVWTTKSSIESRAITLITVSGVLVTLAFGFATAVTKSGHHSNFTPTERSFLVVALALFAFSAVISLRINSPTGYSTPDLRDVLELTAEQIDGEPLERIEAAIKSARALNDQKARWLAWAFVVQLLAVVALAVVVGIVTA